MIEDSNWLREKLHELFGHGWQTRFARFLQLSGDTRPFSTIIRGISSASSGRHRLAGELRALVNLLSRHNDIPDLIKEARRDTEKPMFELLPKPESSAVPPNPKYKDPTPRPRKPKADKPKRKPGRPLGSVSKTAYPTKYPWLSIDVGGSFFVPDVNPRNIRSSANAAGKHYGTQFSCHAKDGGVLVTRVK